MKFALLAALLLVACITTPLAALTARPAQPGEPILVITPPWGVDAASRVASANGTIIGPLRPMFGTLSVWHSDAFIADLRAQGAVLVLSAVLFSSLCGEGAAQ